VLLLALAIALYPLVEFFDRWDTSPLPSNDTELWVTALLAMIGLGVLLAKILPSALRVMRTISLPVAPMADLGLHGGTELPNAVPFPPSTIPLRI
jgi:hypothetical protein